VDKTPEQARIVRMAREVNDGKPNWVVDQIRAAVEQVTASGKKPEEITVALLGLAFKPDIDDLRESPALHIAEAVLGTLRCKSKIVEPYIEEMPRNLREYQLAPLDDALATAD